jgi:hypothetical protein
MKTLNIFLLFFFLFALSTMAYGFEHKETKVYLCTNERQEYGGKLSFVLFEYGYRFLLVEAADNIDKEEGYITCSWKTGPKKGICQPKGGSWNENMDFLYHYVRVNYKRILLKDLWRKPRPRNPEWLGVSLGNHICDLANTKKP